MAEPLHITVCFSPAPRQVCELALTLPAGSTPEEFAAFIDAETAKWGKVIREAKVKLD